MESYNIKLIQSGDHIETYEYKDKEIKTGFTRRGSRGLNPRHTKVGTRKIMKELGIYDYHDYKTNEGRYLVHPDAEHNLFTEMEEAKEKKQKAKSSLSRTRTELRRKINSNPELTTFLTLTFKENITDVKIANLTFNRFIVRMRKERPDFKYIAVIEFQKRGAVHYHLLCDLDISGLKTESETKAYERTFAKGEWKNGFVKIKPVAHVDNMGAYFCKYLSKDMFDERMFGKKKYFCSQNLRQPKKIFNDEARFLIAKISSNSKALFEKEITSKWVGRIEYKNYKIGVGKREKVSIAFSKN